MALRYEATRGSDAIRLRDTERHLVGFYRLDNGDRILAPPEMPKTLNDEAVLDQLFWSVMLP